MKSFSYVRLCLNLTLLSVAATFAVVASATSALIDAADRDGRRS